ncbi:ATP-dependent helicase [Burkholderia sp. Ax-1719]|uniref:ATP-dependent helicase n=1 Tax=Burkholderia sp. Ax-1719 TaxID=2608334 RepID=UPI0014226BB4|nr:ATP-dependent helicase [Burkholderia sp. Ax-1719]NIE66845.1 AAA family ATPase [Burkholderia sp. Ax-1719]
MNPFDRARAEAQVLRQRLLECCDTSTPTSRELLSVVEDELDLAVEKVPADYPALGGGAAVLDRPERSIYVRDDVSEAEFAYLVAHELGHWVLDVDKPQTSVAHLKAMVAGPETPAVAKVEAYGARERQELQANVFARELLLPRDTANSIWKAGKSAHQIAKTYVLPLEIVRVQLLDGVLLPPYTPPPAKPLPAPSEDQRKAAEAKERFVNVVAGPGTGKTTTLVHRVKYLIEDLSVDPSRILVLTFTNKAAFELVERLRNAGISRAADIWAGTFHAFGLEFLRKYHQHFDLNADVLVADRLQQLSLLVKNLPRVELKHYLRVEDPYEWLKTVISCIQRLKEELVSPEEYRSRLQSLGASEEVIQDEREDVGTLYELHENILRDAHMVDFVDLVAKPAMKVRDARETVTELADHFEHILVDEYQDVTEAMVTMVRQLAANAKSLWVVGDVRQAIHHWRGASVKSLLRFEHAFKTAGDSSTVKKYSLDANRRSSWEILELFGQAGRVHVLESRLPLDEMHAVNGKSGSLPELLSCESRTAVSQAVVNEVKKHQHSGISYREQALLCRKTADVEYLATQMRAAGVPILYIGELAHRPEIKRLLCLMQLLCERAPRALVGLSNTAGISMPMSDIAILLSQSVGQIAWQRGRWLGEAPEDLSSAGASTSFRLKSLLAGFSRHTSPWEFVCDMLLDRRFGLPPEDDASLDAQTARLALWQFAYSVRNGDGDMRQATLSRYLLRQQLRQRIGDTHGDRELPPEATAMDAVRVMTVHGSKGLEFEAVHIGYIDADSYGADEPSWNFGDSTQVLVPPAVLGSNDVEHQFETAVERNNLFYVALSRAKNRLQLYENVEFATRARLKQLTTDSTKYLSKSLGEISSADSAAAPEANTSTSLSVKFEEFEAYIRCPLQHHYRYHLGLPNEQEVDAALRARWAVMDTLEEYARNKTHPKQVFYDAWARYQLPSEEDDPQLIRDAKTVCRRGLAVIKELDGTFSEGLVATLRDADVELPWVIETGKGSAARLHLVRFSPLGASATASYLRPLLRGIPGRRPMPMVIHTLVVEQRVDAPISQRPESTTAYKAAGKMCSGQVVATPGRQCSRCSYLTVCPSKPI